MREPPDEGRRRLRLRVHLPQGIRRKRQRPLRGMQVREKGSGRRGGVVLTTTTTWPPCRFLPRFDPCQESECGPNTECQVSGDRAICRCRRGFVGEARSRSGCRSDPCSVSDSCGPGAECRNEIDARSDCGKEKEMLAAFFLHLGIHSSPPFPCVQEQHWCREARLSLPHQDGREPLQPNRMRSRWVAHVSRMVARNCTE